MIRLFGIGEVVLVSRPGFGRRCFRWFAAHFLTEFLLGGALGHFLFVLGQLDGVARLRAGFDLGARFGQRRFAYPGDG